MNRTPIEWTNFTANPLQYRDPDGNVVHACIHKSAGCLHCYAESLAPRYGRKGRPFTAENMKRLTPFLNEKELHSMLTHKPAAGKMCFVGDMTDLFGEWVPFELLDQLFAVFALRPDVTWQILTKRPERMLDYMVRWSDTILRRHLVSDMAYHMNPHRAVHIDDRKFWPLKNVQLGVSVENQATADERIPLLLQTPAAVRFVSYEPALEAVDFRPWLQPCRKQNDHSCANPHHFPSGLDWIIAGSESGHKARPAELDWYRSVRDQCQASGVAFFLKQYVINGKKIGLPELDGKSWAEFPQGAN